LLALVLLAVLSSLDGSSALADLIWFAVWFFAVWFLHRRAPLPPTGIPSAATPLGDPTFAQFTAVQPQVTTRRRRGVWIAVVSVFLLPCLAALALGGWLLSRGGPDGGIGDRALTVRTDAELKDQYWLGAGDMALNLSQLELVRDRTVRVDDGLGEIRVWVPEQANVRAVCQVGIGEAVCGGLDAQTPGKPVLTLELSSNIGEVHVYRGAPPPGWETHDADKENGKYGFCVGVCK
jgi:hypothetical protein